VPEIDGVIKLAPVCSSVPPEEELYQYNCPDPVAVSVKVPVPQRLTFAATGAEGIASTIA